MDRRVVILSQHLVQGPPNLSYIGTGEKELSHTAAVCWSSAASHGALPVAIPLSEHVQLLRNRTSKAVGRTSSYSLVLAWAQGGAGSTRCLGAAVLLSWPGTEQHFRARL